MIHQQGMEQSWFPKPKKKSLKFGNNDQASGKLSGIRKKFLALLSVPLFISGLLRLCSLH